MIRTLGAKGWEVRGIDRVLRNAICAALDVVHAEGVLAYVADRDAHFSCCTPRSGITPPEQRDIIAEAKRRVKDRLSDLLAGNVIFFNYRKRSGTQRHDRVVAVATPTVYPSKNRETGLVDYCAFILHGKHPSLHPPVDERNVTECRSITTVFFDTIRRRLRAFAHLPGEVSERYWESLDPSTTKENYLEPPWEIEDQVRTTTLVFDLRKSTFCMKEAIDPKGFAQWTDHLVQILTKVCHLHGGIFDKFTGDGILAHFLNKECTVVCRKKATRAALACAVDMLAALDDHLPCLRRILHHDCGLLGGGVGIDVARAFWSVDRKGNPITVGEAVVEACRLCDKAKAGKILMTNAAYQELQDNPGAPESTKLDLRARRVKFESKEHTKEMQVRVWQFDRPPKVLGSAPEDIAALCAKVRGGSP